MSLPKLQQLSSELAAIHVSNNPKKNIDWLIDEAPKPLMETVASHLGPQKLVEFVTKMGGLKPIMDKWTHPGFQTFLLNYFRQYELACDSYTCRKTRLEMRSLVFDYKREMYSDMNLFTLVETPFVEANWNIVSLGLSHCISQRVEPPSLVVKFYDYYFCRALVQERLPLAIVHDKVAHKIPSQLHSIRLGTAKLISPPLLHP